MLNRVLVLGMLVLGAQRVHAQAAPRRVALIEPGAALESAVRVVLEPWQVTIVVAPGPAPGAVAPASNVAAREIALAHDAHAVVWISEHQGKHALWVYDLATNQVVERELSTGVPAESAGAAAVALSVKTLLRHSVVVPEAERFGAMTTSAGGSTSTETASAPSNSMSSSRSTVRSSSTPTPTPTPTSTSTSAREMPVLEWNVEAGMRLGAMQPSYVEPRLGLGGQWWPSRGPLGVGLSVVGGPAIAVDRAGFDGSLFDVSGQLSAATRSTVGEGGRVAAAIGFALHVLALEGELASEQSESAVRVLPALVLGLRADWAMAEGVRTGLFVEPSYLIGSERYRVDDRVVLELSHLRGTAGIAVRFTAIE